MPLVEILILHRVISPESEDESGPSVASHPESFFTVVKTEGGDYMQLHREVTEEELPTDTRKQYVT